VLTNAALQAELLAAVKAGDEASVTRVIAYADMTDLEVRPPTRFGAGG
jgi:hypothetical protein